MESGITDPKTILYPSASNGLGEVQSHLPQVVTQEKGAGHWNLSNQEAIAAGGRGNSAPMPGFPFSHCGEGPVSFRFHVFGPCKRSEAVRSAQVFGALGRGAEQLPSKLKW